MLRSATCLTVCAWGMVAPGVCWSDVRTNGTVSGPALTSSGIAWLQGTDQVNFDDRPPLAIPRRSGTRLNVVDDVLVLRRLELGEVNRGDFRVVERSSSAGPLNGPVQRLEGGAERAIGAEGSIYAADRSSFRRFTPDGRAVELLVATIGSDLVDIESDRLLRRVDRLPLPDDPERKDLDRMEVVALRSGAVERTIPLLTTMADGRPGSLFPTDLRSDGSVVATGLGSDQASVVIFGADGSGPRVLMTVPFDSNQRVGLQAKWSGSRHVVVSGPRPVGLQRIDLLSGQRQVIATTTSGRVRPAFDAEESSDRVAWRQRACAAIFQRTWTVGKPVRAAVPTSVCRLPTRRVLVDANRFAVALQLDYPLRTGRLLEDFSSVRIDVDSSTGLRLRGRRSRGPLRYGTTFGPAQPQRLQVTKLGSRLIRRNPRRSVRVRLTDSEAAYETVVRTRAR